MTAESTQLEESSNSTRVQMVHLWERLAAKDAVAKSIV